jgi:mRNA-degrading endonuclease toxin of MazEF toxin-antitoxin module
MKPGDLVTVRFPFSENETVEFKQRPVLILAMTGTGDNETVLVAMVTGNTRRFKTPGKLDVRLEDWESYGLLDPSTVRINRVWAAEGRDVVRSIGSVSDSVLADVKARLTALIEG